MQFEILLNSRTYQVDYRWIARPDYLSEDLCRKAEDLMYLLERAGNMTDEDYLRNIFFYADESGGILIRGGYSATTDKFGRQIYSVEGIACPADGLRRFWYALPALTAWMSQCPLFRDTWVYGMAEDADLTGLLVDVGELPEEGKDLLYESGFYAACPPYVQACLRYLQEDARAAERIYPFAFIPGDSPLYLGSLPAPGSPGAPERVYAGQHLAQLLPLPQPDPEIYLQAQIPDDGYHIAVEMTKNEGVYYARLAALDEEGRVLAFLDRELAFDAVGLEVSRLESAARQLREAIRLYGFDREV